jgi:hypothetical protein
VLQSMIHGCFNTTNSYVCMVPVPVNDIVSNSVVIICRLCSMIGRKSQFVHAVRERHGSDNYLNNKDTTKRRGLIDRRPFQIFWNLP